MSREIDERIVQMKFESGQFEKNVQTSIHSLDELKRGLDFKDATKGLEGIDKASKGLKFDGLSAGIEALNNRFTLLGITGLNVMNRIANAAIDTGERMIKSLSTDQITTGWDKYGNKTQAVQTIMSATAKQFTDTGEQMEYVNSQLDKLNWFTDETSYNFLEMVNNIGKFTSNNISLDQSVTSMQGIATWAAQAGANANEASRAMYNLSQAISVGSVKLIDWKSIENANMATASFKEQVIQAALAEGTLIKQGDKFVTATKKKEVSVSNFNEALSEGWFNSKVLLSVLDKYGTAANRLNEIVEETGVTTSVLIGYIDDYSEGTADLAKISSNLGLSLEDTKSIMEEFQTETMQFGLKAFKAAQEAKTFREAIESVKDAVSSGWMQTFEYIFGDYEKAKELWTDVANILYTLFAESGNNRNALLSGWADLGGREELLASMYNIYSAILKIINQIRLAWRSVFPAATVKSLLQLTDALYDFTRKLIISDKAAYTLQQAFRGLFLILDTLRFMVSSLASSAFGVLKRVLAELNIDLSKFVAKFTMGTVRLNEYVKNQTWATTAIEKFGDILVAGIRKIKEFIAMVENFGPVRAVIDAFHATFTSDFQGIGSIITFLGNTFSNFLALLADTPFPKGLNDIKDFFLAFGQMVSEELSNIGIDFGAFFDNILPGFKSFSETLHTLPNGFREARDTAGDLIKYLGNVIKTIDWSGVALLGLGVAIVAMVYKIADAVTAVSNSLLAFTKIGASIQKVTNAWASVLTSVANVVDSAKFAVYGAAMVEFAVAIGILTASIIALSRVPTDDLMNVSFTIGMLGAVLAGFVYAMSFIKEVPAVAGVLVAYAVTIAVFVHAMNSIDVSDVNAVINKMAVIGIMLGALVGTSYLMGKYVKPITVGTWSLIGIVASVWLMINLLKGIAKEDPKELTMASVIIVSLMGALALISRLLTVTKVLDKDQQAIKATSIAKLIGLVFSLYLLIGAIKLLGKSDPKVITAGILMLIPIFVELALLFKSVTYVSQNAAQIGPMLLGVTLALHLLHGVIKKMAELSIEEMAKGGAAITALSRLVFIPLIKASAEAGPNAAKAGLMLLAMAGTMAILQLVVKTLGQVDFITLAKGVAATTALMLSMAPLIKSLGTSDAHTTKNLTRIAIIIGLLGAILFILAKFTDTTKALVASIGISSVLLSLSGTMFILDKLKEPRVKTLYALMGALVIVSAIVAVLGHFGGDPSIALATAGAIGLIFLAIGASFKLMDNVTIPEIKKINTYLGVLIVVGIIMATLAGISKDADPATCMVMATAMSEILLALAGAIVIMSNTKSKPSEKNAIAMTWFVGAIGAVMVILAAMSKEVNPVAALALATGVSEIMIALGVAARLMTETKMPKEDVLLKWTALIGGIGMILGIVSLIPFDTVRLISLATGISELLLALSASVWILGSVDTDAAGKATATMFALTGLMAAVGVVIGVLSFMVNPDTVLPIVTSMSLMLLALSGCVAILSVIPAPDMGTAITAVGSMIILIGGMALLMYALGRLVNGADAMTILQNGGEVLKQIGIAIGGFIGGIVGGLIGGIGAGVMASFPYICQALTDGAQNLQGFYDMLENIPGGVLGMIGTLVGMVAAITAAEFISGLKVLPGIGTILGVGMATLPADFASLGIALKAFSDSLGDMNAVKVKYAAEAVSALAEVNADTATGGLFGFLFGNSDFEKFANNLPTLGAGLKSFAKETDGIGPETVEAAVNAAEILIALEKSVAPTGGLLNSKLFGETDIGAFGERLQTFGRSMVAFCRIISGETGNGGINQAAVDAAHNAGQMMIDLEKSLPPNGGIIQDLFLGNKDLAGFGLRLRQFATGLVTLGSECSTLDTTGVSRAIWASRQLISLEGSITTTSGGLWGSLFGGESSFKTFGNNLIDLGEGLRMLGNKASVTNFDGIKEIMNVLTQLGDVGDVEKAIKSLVNNVGEMISSIQKTIRDGYQPTLLTAKRLGEHIVTGITLGVRTKIKSASDAIGTMAQALIERFRKEMEIHSPSVKMEREGEYVVMGVAEGIEKNTSAEEAASKKAQNIISAFQTIFDNADLKINLGNVQLETWNTTSGRGAGWQAKLEQQLIAKRNELEATGEKVKASYAKWVALQQAGVDEKSIREAEIAYLEASNSYRSLQSEIIDLQIDSAESMIEEIDLLDEVRQAEYDRWLSTKEGKNASAAEKTTKEMELMVSQLESLADTTAILRAQHQAMIDEFGEDSTEARNAYIKVLNSEKKLNETYDSIMEKQKGSYDSIKEARDAAIRAYSEFMDEVAPKLLEMGFTEEQIEQQAKEFSNWDKAWGEEIAGGITTERIDAAMDRADAEISLVKEELVDTIGGEAMEGITIKFEEGLPLAIKKAGQKAKSAAEQAGAENGDAYGDSYVKSANDKISQGLGKIGASIPSGISDGMRTAADRIGLLDVAKDTAEAVTDVYASVWEINSPSHVMQRLAGGLIEGIVLGLNQNGNKAADAASEVADSTIAGMSALTTNLTSLLQDNIDLDPVITPVLDMDEIIAQSKDIPGILNANNGLDVSSIDIQANRVSASLKKTGTIPDPDNQDESSGTTYNFTQNNYSPKALSRYDIYRQTRNQFSQLKGATSK